MNTKLIMESWRRFLKEATWSNSPDEDWPAFKSLADYQSNKVILFDENDSYGDTGANSHGRDSHMAKHWMEFVPAQIQDSINKSRAIIQQYSEKGNKIYYQIKDSKEVLPMNFTDIKNGDIINLYDHINDKKFDGETLLEIEEKIYNEAMMISINPYDKTVDNMMSSAYDVADAIVKNEQGLINALKKNPIIKFIGKYEGENNTYYFDTRNAAMVSEKQDQTVATLFRIRDKGGTKSSEPQRQIRGFYTGAGTEPTDDYSILRSLADSQKGPSSQQTTKKKKQQNQQNKTSQTPQEFARGLATKGMSADKIKDIMSKKFSKIPPKGIDGILQSLGIK